MINIARLEVKGESLSLQGFTPSDKYYCLQWLVFLLRGTQGLLVQKISFFGHGTVLLQGKISEIVPDEKDLEMIAEGIWNSCKEKYEKWGKG